MKKLIGMAGGASLLALAAVVTPAAAQDTVTLDVTGEIPVLCTLNGGTALNFDVQDQIREGNFDVFDVTDTTFNQFTCNTDWTISAIGASDFVSDDPSPECDSRFATSLSIVLNGSEIAEDDSDGSDDDVPDPSNATGVGVPQAAVHNGNTDPLEADWDILGDGGPNLVCAGTYSGEAYFTIDPSI